MWGAFYLSLEISWFYYHFQIESTMSTQFTIVYINIIESKIVCSIFVCCFFDFVRNIVYMEAKWLASSFHLMRFIKTFSIRLLWRAFFCIIHILWLLPSPWVEEYFTTKMSNDEWVFWMHACGSVDVRKRMSGLFYISSYIIQAGCILDIGGCGFAYAALPNSSTFTNIT